MTDAVLPPDGEAPRRGPRRRWRRLIGLIVVVDLVFLVVNGLWLAAYLREEGPPFPPGAFELIQIHLTAIALGSVVAIPASIAIGVLADRIDLPRGEVVLAALLGVFGFLAAAQINDAIVLQMGITAGSAPEGGFDIVSLAVAPAVEEPVKLLALVAMAILLRPAFGVRAGILLGLAVGIGATLIEAGAYLQIQYSATGGPIYGTIIALRFGLFGLGLHATTAALLGAGLGFAMTPATLRARQVPVLLALAGALATHVTWNLWASGLTLDLVKALTPEPDFGSQEPFAQHVIWAASSAVAVLLLAPATVALFVAWRRAAPDPAVELSPA